MNNTMYKVIFNKRMGKMDVVSEITNAEGKASSDASSTGSWLTQLAFKPLTFALMLLSGGLVIVPAQAQIVADPSAPGNQRPTVLTTASGATQVNIQTPSAQGVSMNQYKQFDTQSNGTVLNNSRTNVQTQTAGWVQGNPWLATGPARIIVNQVNSNNPSYLNGSIEVAGARSQVIIANPSGINVNGASFINASRTTLTTGNPIINGGNLEGYRVSRGVINIDGQGLNTSDSDYTDILARSVKANAGIWAKTLSIVTGANLVNTTAGVTGSVAAEGTASASYSIDTAALGGMYGNKIYLVGTEAGLGVNNAGQIAASAGDVAITADGLLINSGTISSNGQANATTINTTAVQNSGTISAQGDNRIQTNQLTNSGTIAAGRELKATATTIDNSNGVINGQRLDITANSLNNTKGKIQQTGATQSLALNAGSLTNINNGVIGYEPLDTGSGSGGSGGSSSGGSDSGGSGVIDVPTTAAGGGTATVVQPAPLPELANGIINVTGNVFNDAGIITANGGIDLTTSNGLTNAATLNLNKLKVTGDALNNAGGTITTTTADISTNSITNTAGKLSASGNMDLVADTLTNTAGTISTGGAFKANITSTTLNDDGNITSVGEQTLITNTLNNNNGLVSSVADLTIQSTNIDNFAGEIHSDETASIKSTGNLNNTQGLISARKEVSVQDAQATKTLVVTNTAGTIMADELVSVNALSLTGDGKLTSNKDLSLALTSDFNNSTTLQAVNNLSLSTTGNVNNTAKILAGGTNSITAQNIINANNAEITGTNTTLTSTDSLTNRGLIDGGNTVIKAGTVLNNIGTGQLYGDHLSIQAGELNNLAEDGKTATIAARQRLDIGVIKLNNLDQSTIYSDGAASIGRVLDSTNKATGQADLVNNLSATIDVAGQLDISTATLNNERKNVVVTHEGLTSVDETIQMHLASWQGNGGNSGSLRGSANYRAYEIYYINPADVLETSTVFTPDGYSVGKAVVRLTPQTTAYFFARGRLYGATGERSRLTINSDGTTTIYYTLRQDNQVNPDQVAGGDDPFYEQSQPDPTGPAFSYQSDTVTYDNNYGTCTNNCIQLVTPYQYTDPTHTIVNRRQTSSSSGNEQQRIAHHTAKDDTINADAGTLASIRSGEAMNLTVANQLTNRYGDIIAGGNLTIDNKDGNGQTTALSVTNSAETLYRTHYYNNTTISYNGNQVAWSNSPRSEEIGQLKGNITSGGTLTINADNINNLNNTRNAPNIQGIANSGNTAPEHDAQTSIPNSSLFSINPNAAGYLIQTDPRFAGYRQWLSSDYMLGALNLDPSTMHKRLGDGYYEQKLIREQVAQLTGRRFLNGQSNDDEQYKALMNAGVTFASAHQLRLGIALTDAQIARLTSDIVWFVEETVTLPDGTQKTALVPKVYVAVKPGDVHRNGALIAGDQVKFNLSGDLVNTGDIAGRKLVKIDADNINNLRGAQITGNVVQLSAKTDINNIGATILANDAAILDAKRNVNIASTTRLDASTGQFNYSDTAIDRVAGVYVDNLSGLSILSIKAGNDVNLTAAQIVNAGTNDSGFTQIVASNDINLSTVNVSRSDDETWDAKNYRRTSSSLDVGTQIVTNGDTQLIAGNDINAKAAAIDALGGLTLQAGHDVSLTEGQATSTDSRSSYRSSSKWYGKKSNESTYNRSVTNTVGTSVMGDTVTIQAGNDYTQRGSDVLGFGDVNITAKNDVTIESTQDTFHVDQSALSKRSGFTAGYSAGVASVGYGKSKSASQNSLDVTTQRGSTVESLYGNTTVKAGNQLTIAASDVAAAENLTLVGKDVNLEARQDTLDEHSAQQSKSSGFTVGLTVNPFDAFSTAYKNTYNNTPATGAVGKITRLADSITAGVGAATTPVVVTAGSKRSSSSTDHSVSEARVSSLTAGGNLTILATDGSINSQGTQMSAEGDALILAKENINFDVAHNYESEESNSKSSGWSFDNRGNAFGKSILSTVGVHKNKANGEGETDTITGTQLSVGGKATLATTKGDITLTGSNIVANDDVSISAARNLTIASGQDTVSNENHSNKKAIGSVVISDTERFSGYHSEKRNNNEASVTQVASNVASLDGNVNLTAGEKYTQTASNVMAANDVTIKAKSIELLTADNTGTAHQDSKDLKIGVFARVSSPLIDLVNNVEAARQSDGRLSELQNMAAAANGVQAVAAAAGQQGTLFKAEVGIGVASAKSRDDMSYQVAQGSAISGGRNVTLTSTEGDIHAVGANITAGKALTLDSADDILLEAAKSTSSSSGKNSSWGVEAGVGFQVGAQTGAYVYVQAQAGKGKYDTDTTTHSNTHLSGETISINSKGDTTLRGADARANTINADVGGKLAIESLQDTAEQHSKQTSVGGRVQVSFGTAWEASGNYDQSKTNGTYVSVGQQSGLFAGDGGYHVKADTVDLKGGAITSTNAAQSSLTANALTFSDLQNVSSYETDSTSVNVSANSKVSNVANLAQNVLGNLGNLTNNQGGEPTNATSITKATLTEGNITIGGQATSAAATGINTDATTAHQALSELPDLRALLAEQQAQTQAVNTISSGVAIVVANAVNYGQNSAVDRLNQAELDLAKVNADPASTPEAIDAATNNVNAAINNADHWKQDGLYTIATNAVGSIVVGLAADKDPKAIAATIAAPLVADAIGDAIPADNKAAKFVAHGIAAGLIATLAGADTKEALAAGLATGLMESVGAPAIVKALYGDVDPSTLNPEQKATVLALTGSAGAILAGIIGDSSNAAGYGAAGTLNAVENNFLTHDDASWLKRALSVCGDDSACQERVVRQAQRMSAENEDKLAQCVIRGDVACANSLKNSAADASEIPHTGFKAYDDHFIGRANAMDSGLSSQEQNTLRDIANYRAANCGGLTVTQCDQKVGSWLVEGDQKALGLVATTLGMGAPSAIKMLITAYKAGKEVYRLETFSNKLNRASEKFPESLGQGKANSKGEGWRWNDGKGNGVRIDKGNPNSPFPAQRVDHVVINSGGKVIGKDGKPINGSIKDDPVNAHIPLSQYLNWKNWNSPW